jgi:hypothetical protein
MTGKTASSYRDRLRAMMRTRRYKISLAVILFAVLAWCAVNAWIIVAGISSGTIRQPETMTRAQFVTGSIAYWISLPLIVGIVAVLIVHVALPYLVTLPAYDHDAPVSHK